MSASLFSSFRGFMRFGALAIALLLAPVSAWADSFSETKAADGTAMPPGDVYASVGTTEILWSEYWDDYSREKKNRFYHGTVPETERAGFEQAVSAGLIEEVLLADEARERGFQPDQQWVKESLDSIDKSNLQNPQWPQLKAFWLPRIEARLERQSLSEQLEKQVKDIPDVTLGEVRNYYSLNSQKFTQPAQSRLSLILIGVPAASLNAQWAEAESQAKALQQQIIEGENFAKLANLFSSDSTADNGGDMGFIHTGMLGGSAQQAVDELSIGESTDPIHLLDGVALFRLTDRKPPALQTFDLVEQRARDLHHREAVELAWKSLIFRLRQATEIQINQSPPSPLKQ